MRILLLDDEPFQLRLLTRQLSEVGFTDVESFDDALDALRAIEADVQRFDTVMCDLQMPEMDGVEFIRHLARIKFAGALVLISGEDERILQSAQKLAQAHRLNVTGALSKPVVLANLRQLLGEPPARKGGPRDERKRYEPARLAQALAQGELVNFYQPKVSMRTGALTGVETLVRWRHPDDGLVFPDQFITLAEENNLIDDLTRSVLKGALRQAHAWDEVGIAVHVAVNVSMDNLASLDFPDFVASAMREAQVPLRALVLEVTESRLMTNAVASLEILTRLRLKHIGLSIDDFGTGHSSLAQLRDIPFDELKVDRGFVHGAASTPGMQAILEGALGMARQLGMRSVAEGVEDRPDWNLLRSLGCDVAQGYFIAKPMPAADLAPWLETWEQRRVELFAE
jgi:EAL domain-containing protein (putative c-di-GMP-specific phosphodiesterase class I)